MLWTRSQERNAAEARIDAGRGSDRILRGHTRYFDHQLVEALSPRKLTNWLAERCTASRKLRLASSSGLGMITSTSYRITLCHSPATDRMSDARIDCSKQTVSSVFACIELMTRLRH
jgi:hypothetical protein